MHPSTFVFAAVTTLATFAIATPPACFLAAVMEQPNPADTKAICGTYEPQMAGNLTTKCSGDNFKAAVAVYSSTCKEAEKVDITVTMPSASSTATGSSPASATAPAATTTGSGGNGAGTGPGTGSGTGTGAGPSATSKNGAPTVSAKSTGFWLSSLFGCGLVIQYLL